MAIQSYISDVTLPNGDIHPVKAAAIPYGEVDSTSTSTAFTATVPGVMSLEEGTCVLLRNGQITSASGFTININGFGAKPVYNSMATGNDRADPVTAPTRDTTIFNVAYTMLFIYSTTLVEGGCWICYRGYDANTNTIGYQLRTNSSTMPMKQITYRYRILFTSLDGQGWVPSTTSTSTNATAKRDVNQAVIDPFGAIVYYGTTTSVAAGSNPSAASLWQQYTMTFGYAFNRTGAALVLPYPKPIYIKAAPQSGGGAIIDADQPYVFTLPSTEDGKIYIYLGRTYSATAVEITLNHPVYYYKDGAIREWINPTAGQSIPSATANNTTGITIDDHTTGSITGVQSTTTTASKVTLGTAISVPNVTSAGSASNWVFEDITVPKVASSATTVPIKATSATTVPIKDATATSIPNVTAAGSGSFTQGEDVFTPATHGADSFTPNTPTVINTSKFNAGSYSHTGFNGGSFTRGTFNGGSGSFTQGSFSGGSLTMTMDTTDTKKLNITFTAATHGADSHTHTAATHANDSFTAATYGTDNFTAPSLGSGFYTAGTAASFTQGSFNGGSFEQGTDTHTHIAPTLGTAISIYGVQSSTTSVTGVQSTTTSVTGVSGSVTASHVKSGGNGTAPTLGTAISIPNVTGVDDIIVPIKDTNATTVVTSKTHTVNDNGHIHSLQ